jgi:hypothetical protein
MIVLKPYQNRVLGSLRNFLRACSAGDVLHQAFHDVLAANEFPAVNYFPVTAEGLGSAMPYVCLRVPTGGGKTLLACHAAGIAKSELLRAERAVVLWLVPSQTILSQTVDADLHAIRRLDFGEAIRNVAKGLGFALGEFDFAFADRGIPEVFENHAGDLRIKRHAALGDFVEGAQDFERTAGLDEVALLVTYLRDMTNLGRFRSLRLLAMFFRHRTHKTRLRSNPQIPTSFHRLRSGHRLFERPSS